MRRAQSPDAADTAGAMGFRQSRTGSRLGQSRLTRTIAAVSITKSPPPPPPPPTWRAPPVVLQRSMYGPVNVRTCQRTAATVHVRKCLLVSVCVRHKPRRAPGGAARVPVTRTIATRTIPVTRTIAAAAAAAARGRWCCSSSCAPTWWSSSSLPPSRTRSEETLPF